MKFGILGTGNTGKAYSALLAQEGHQVILYSRDEAKLEPLRRGIAASGVVEGLFSVDLTADLKDLADCDVLLVCTLAAGHRPLARALKGLLRQGQMILVTNGCWGAVEFDMELGQEAEEKGCVIAETGGQLILCSTPEPGSVFLKSLKKSIAAATVRRQDQGAMMERLGPVFPQIYPVGSVLETSLNSANSVPHGPLMLFNITRVENGEDFLLFDRGVTVRVARFMEKIDRERVAVIEACGIKAPTELEMLNSFWGGGKESLYELFHQTPAYAATKGPTTLDHRYLTEDLPYGLVPYLRLGRQRGVPTPHLEALIALLGAYMDLDYFSMGPEVEKLDLSRYR